MRTRTYTELSKLKTFKERIEYLKLDGKVGIETFGFDRVYNQMFYKSDEWRNMRDKIITRDLGCNLGVEGFEIPEGVSIYIHHMNPITLDDIKHSSEYLLNPEYLIVTTHKTHMAIHYGDVSLLDNIPVERSKINSKYIKSNQRGGTT